MTLPSFSPGTSILPGEAEGDVLHLAEGLSFWGGVDPESGAVIDARHPASGASVAGRVLVMATSRGSCSGSSVLLQLALGGRAPAALVFREAEEVLTLGALVAALMFEKPLPVLRLAEPAFSQVAAAGRVRIGPGVLEADGMAIPLSPPTAGGLSLGARDREMLSGHHGDAARVAMEIIVAMARTQGAATLTDVSRGHIDGCIYHSEANLIFAERMLDLGARVSVPTTINAISVDREHWQAQGVTPGFGAKASRLADAYVAMGARPTFTCAPYLLDGPPALGETIGWSESNAVIYANSVLGARTAKHPDYFDLCIAITGRAPMAGVYLAHARAPARVIEVPASAGIDDAFWPLLGWLAGRLSPDRVPLLTGLEHAAPGPDDLKALCAAFGTTSAAPMLHVAGHTPEAHLEPLAGADRATLGPVDFRQAWHAFNAAPGRVDLVAIGSPHASLAECRRFADLLDGRRCHPETATIVTLGRDVLEAARSEGLIARLEAAGVRLIPDICWCSITEPVFPPEARVLLTNSGKYAHYAPGLSGREVRFAGLAGCAHAALTGDAAPAPAWLGL